MSKVKQRPYYVDPAELAEEIRKYQDHPELEPSNKLGEMIIKIATRFFSQRNWSSYSYKQDMIADSIARIYRFMYKINPDHNPFSYISQICYNVGLQKLKKENKETLGRRALAEMIFEEYQDQEVLNLNFSQNDEGE
jgi:DNA-directed RNA polymerase specialized sigma24 family protein